MRRRVQALLEASAIAKVRLLMFRGFVAKDCVRCEFSNYGNTEG